MSDAQIKRLNKEVGIPISPELHGCIQSSILDGRPINAIKILRDATSKTGLSLKQIKQLTEDPKIFRQS